MQSKVTPTARLKAVTAEMPTPKATLQPGRPTGIAINILSKEQEQRLLQKACQDVAKTDMNDDLNHHGKAGNPIPKLSSSSAPLTSPEADRHRGIAHHSRSRMARAVEQMLINVEDL